MRRITSTFRTTVAVLLVVFGLIILGRGAIQGAPFTYMAMGGLMAGLGVYRLRLMFGLGRQR